LTCQKIIQTSKQFREQLIERILNFSALGSKEPFRTADVIKGILCLATQFYTLINIENFTELIEKPEHKAIFEDEAQLRDIKNNFVRFGIEEHLRRIQREPESITEKIKTILFPEATVNFIEPIWKLRKIEIDDLMQPKGDDGNDVYAKYKPMADQLRQQYGYGKAKEVVK